MKSVINNETLPQAMWDEENRLKHVYDEEYTLSSYLYDAGGERTLKLWDGYQYMMINGQQQIGFFDITDYTLYTSPYMVLTPEQYTKHYYAESDRIVSKIGGGMQNNIYPIGDQIYGFNLQNHGDYLTKADDLVNMMYDDYNQLNVSADLNANFNYWLNDAINQDEPEEMIFFYHKDHLGSSTQISDPGANIIQHIEYLPYGECFFERRSYWNTPYKFNAKELDAETGLYYYGARYYTPEVSIWLSVDPLAQERSWLSPYNYCQLNPVKLVDPTGMLDDDFYFDKDGRLLNYVENDEPDRVFILEENQVESDDPNLVPKPVFKQVDMSSEEIEKKMENNGYRKVTSKVEVTNDEVSTSVPTGVFGSRTIINGYEITVGIDEKYVEKDKILLGRENTKTIERTVNNNGFETYTYERYTEDVRYGNKEKSFSFINWYLKIGVTDCRRKSEINVKW